MIVVPNPSITLTPQFPFANSCNFH